MLQEVTFREIERIFAVTDPLGISREALVIPLLPRTPGRVRRMPNGKLELVVGQDFEVWLAGLPDALRAAGAP